MDNKILDTLEHLEDRIESIKWLIAAHFRPKKTSAGETSIIRKSFGILDKHSPKGTVYENKVRREWEANFIRRVS